MLSDFRMSATSLVVLAATFAFGAHAAFAGAATDAMAAAEALAAQKPPMAAAALDGADKAIDALWAQLPLTIRTVAFADNIVGYGVYDARASNVFAPGADTHVYAPLAGYGFRPIKGGYRIEITTGFIVQTADGKTIARTDDYGSLISEKAVEDHQFVANVPITLPDLRPGAYVLHLTLRDLATAKIANADLPFSIMPQLSPPSP